MSRKEETGCDQSLRNLSTDRKQIENQEAADLSSHQPLLLYKTPPPIVTQSRFLIDFPFNLMPPPSSPRLLSTILY